MELQLDSSSVCDRNFVFFFCIVPQKSPQRLSTSISLKVKKKEKSGLNIDDTVNQIRYVPELNQ